eukprot:gb/GECG01009251.1/.p1 GENE.gb/GECG01009251.1/~~gb/GECG01009251.1/.p1  ORF type:complete len:104 (+),score=13.52 gb/GECG01009251.1/:1-312(+)
MNVSGSLVRWPHVTKHTLTKKSLMEHIHRDHEELTLEQLEECITFANTNDEEDATRNVVVPSPIKSKRAASQDPPLEYSLSKRKLDPSFPKTPVALEDPLSSE